MRTFAPYTKVFLHEVYSISITSNGHIQVLDSATGTVIYSTSKSAELADKVERAGEVVAAAVDENFKYLVTATSTKFITAWEIKGLIVVSEREAPKKPTDVCFARDGQTILVSDKFGDVHRYPLQGTRANDVQEGGSDSGSSDLKVAKKRLEDGALLLGHVSLLTALLLSKDEKYIITADRDEHIRVSWYPEAYTIESYCVGHRKFVSALHIPLWDASLLISGGGDPELRIWNWMEGRLLYEIPVADVIMPLVKVVRKKPSRGDDGGDDGEQEVEPKGGSRGKRGGKKKRRGKGHAKPDGGSDGESREDRGEDMQIDEQPERPVSTDNGVSGSAAKQTLSEPSPLLAISKISTLESGLNRFLLFSAHGAMALFYCKFPDLSNLSPVQVHSLPLEYPVLDLAPWPRGDEVCVLVDGNWSEATSSSKNEAIFVKTVKVVNNELALSDDTDHRTLVAALNTTSRIEASQDELRGIDLYSPLTVLPKNVEAEHNAMDDEVLLSETAAQKLSGKELGRLKTKKAVLALQTMQSGKRKQSGTPDNDRSLKRQKSGSEAGVE